MNERHYGALQGLNKAEAAKRYGEEQVLIWRRSCDVPPPLTITESNIPTGTPLVYELNLAPNFDALFGNPYY